MKLIVFSLLNLTLRGLSVLQAATCDVLSEFVCGVHYANLLYDREDQQTGGGGLLWLPRSLEDSLARLHVLLSLSTWRRLKCGVGLLTSPLTRTDVTSRSLTSRPEILSVLALLTNCLQLLQRET